MGQKSVKFMALLFPVATLAVLFVGPCRIPAMVSFLEVLLVLPGISPLCSAHRLSPQLFLKWLEFNQNIHFLLNPFKAQCGAAVILFLMTTDERISLNFLFNFLWGTRLVSVSTLLTVDPHAFT